MSKPVRFVCGEGLREAIRIIRKAKGGISIPDLAAEMEVSQSTADNYVRRLYDAKLVSKYQGETPGYKGRPPMVWEWNGKDVELVAPEALQEAAHQEAVARKAARRAEELAARAEALEAQAQAHQRDADKAQARLAKAKTYPDRVSLAALVRRHEGRAFTLLERAAKLRAQATGKPAKGKAKPAPKAKAPAKGKAKPASKAKAPKAEKTKGRQMTEAQREAKRKADRDRRAKAKAQPPAADATAEAEAHLEGAAAE